MQALKKIINIFSLSLLLAVSACGRSLSIDLEKDSGEDKVSYTIRHDKLQQYIGHTELHVDVVFPPKYRNHQIRFQMKLRFSDASGSSVTVGLPRGLPFEISEIKYRQDDVVVFLEDLPAPGASKIASFYKSPPKPLFEISEHLPKIGIMSQVKDSIFFGLIPVSTSACTSFPIGNSLVMTNHHCVSTQDQCRASVFTFWNSSETGFLGNTISRDFPCSKLLYTHPNLDMSIVQTAGDPTKSYGSLKMMKTPRRLREGTPVIILSQNPRGTKRSNHCIIGESGKRFHISGTDRRATDSTELQCTAATISGDSGSPVLNYDGDLVGIFWGKSVDDGRYGTMTPISALLSKGDSPLEELPVEWVSR